MPCYGARSVFVSDMHLGWSGSRPQRALAWLAEQRPQHLYLVGDTFEGITRPLDLELPCVRTLFDALECLQEAGCSIHILVGNHDHQLAESPAAIRWPIESHTFHTTAEGKKFLVVHGDIFDASRSHHQGPTRVLGGWGYPLLVHLGHSMGQAWEAPRTPWNTRHRHWCSYWKSKSARVAAYLSRYERFMVDLARDHACDGVICGHIHIPALKQIHDPQMPSMYINCGDWIEHGTCVVETQSGAMHLVLDGVAIAGSDSSFESLGL
jgi:UDP-2,3-diacylglucosamine pyrophosphatase LpxH